MSQYFHKPINNNPVKLRKRSGPAWWIYLTIIIGCFIAYGFVAAARNHFDAVDLGYKSEDLKLRRAKLEVEQRKLTLELERRKAPQKLDLRAQQQGLVLPQTHTTAGTTRPTTGSAD